MTAPEGLAGGLADVAPLAVAYLERQSWYQAVTGGSARPTPVLVATEWIRPGPPGLARLVLEAGDHRFQLLLGWRPAGEAAALLGGREAALLGPVTIGGDPVLAYDALADDALCAELLAHVTSGGEHATMVRRVSTLVSHASLVFDERLFMKCYRVLERGPRPEVEVMLRLDAVGFNAMLAPVAHWRVDGCDLALVREFQPSALEGRLLAFTSLRDLLAHAYTPDDTQPVERVGPDTEPTTVDPDVQTAAAGGDLASEMRRLGSTTARLHLALAEAFGVADAAAETFASALGSGVAASARPPILPGGAGRAVRLHGDYHLRRVMRSEAGWLVAGFGDDPLYGAQPGAGPAAVRRGSPLEDLADMCVSLRAVAREALGQRAPEETGPAAHLARAWIRRNESALLGGYEETDEVASLLPRDAETTRVLLEVLVREKELRYEATSSET